MKKFFTLISMALVAMSINAQTESWYVNNEDGTLKADYVANEDASAMSVVKILNYQRGGYSYLRSCCRL